MSLITKYKERVQIHHGWEVGLQCLQCGRNGVPAFEDGTIDTKKVHKNLADVPMIRAKVMCSECGHDIKEQAGEKLAELFSNTPKRFGWPSVLMGVLFFLPILVFGMYWVGAIAGWWQELEPWYWGVFFLLFLVFLVGHYFIHPKMYSCECGNPKFLFMGTLGRSYCFRCSSCSRLLRRGW